MISRNCGKQFVSLTLWLLAVSISPSLSAPNINAGNFSANISNDEIHENDIVLVPDLTERYKDLGRTILESTARRRKRSVILKDDVIRPTELSERYINETHDAHSIHTRSADEFIIEVAIFSDFLLYRYVKERYPDRTEQELISLIDDIIPTVIASVQLYLDGFESNIKVKIVKKEMLTSNSKLYPTMDIFQYLTNFCNFQSEMEEKTWDHAILLTGLDLSFGVTKDTSSSGMAFLSGMCSNRYSCTIAESRSLGTTSLIVAHELAHNLGVEHDGDENTRDCDPESFIMGPKLSPGAVSWSDCSKRQLKQFLSRYGGCLRENFKQNTQPIPYEQITDPGQYLDGNEQCHLLYGQDWSYYLGRVSTKEINNPCQAIWCRQSTRAQSPNAAALQGTTCARGRICRKGQCVSRSSGSTAQTSGQPLESQDSVLQTTTNAGQRSGSSELFNNRRMTICEFFQMFGIRLKSC